MSDLLLPDPEAESMGPEEGILQMPAMKITIEKEKLQAKPRHRLKATKKHKTAKDYRRKPKHAKGER